MTDERARERGSWVYFAEAVGAERVKIGWSGSVWARITRLQSSCPHAVRVVCLVRGGPQREAEFHERFAAYRENGEWFRLEGELASWLDERVASRDMCMAALGV